MGVMVGTAGVGLCDNLDLMDFVLWDMSDFGRGAERADVRGGGPSSSSMSGVRERPSESLKLFSLGIVVQVVVVVVTAERVRKQRVRLPLVMVSPLPWAFIRGRDRVSTATATYGGAIQALYLYKR